MTLRSKTVLIVIFTMCFLIGVVFSLADRILRQRSEMLEEQIVRDNVSLVRDTLSNEITGIDKFTMDWSSWDETYEFAKTRSKKYILTNLSHDEILKQQLSFLVYVNASGKIIYSQGLSVEYDKDAPVFESLLKYIAAAGPLINHPDSKSIVKGIIALPECVVLIVSRPILTSEYKGPIAGALIVGKYLSPTKIEALAQQTHLSIALHGIDNALLPPSITQLLFSATEPKSVIVKADNQNQITGYMLIKDIYDKPCAVLSVHVPRVLYNQYRSSQYYFIVAFILVVLLTGVIVLVFMEKIILSPLSRLSVFIRGVQSTETLSDRIMMDGKDEIAAIGSGINTMLEKLEQDIVMRRQVEMQIKESRDFLENIFKTSVDGILITAKHSIIVMANDAAAKMFGYPKEELIGKTMTEFIPPGDIHEKKGIEFITRLFEEGFINCFASQYLHRDGHLIDIEISAAVIKDSEGNITGSVSFYRDIAERKRAEEEKTKLETQLSRSEKMETIGLLAGGVAHDLNNMLGAIVGYPELLLIDLPPDSPLRPAMKAIKDSGDRAAAIVQDLLTLTRRGVSVNEIINLNTIVRKYFESREWEKLKEFYPEAIVQQHLDPLLLNVVGSPVHLSKAIANLLSNAAEAVSRGGKIEIITENRYLDTPLKAYDNIAEGDYIVLSVSDNGIGIAEEDLQRIFEPFYTKKVMGRSGTGLGMSVVWGTVKDHGGYIDVVSQQDKGTTITLYFPATREEFKEKEKDIPLESYRGRGERILVIDDIAAQRDIARAILTKLQYRVDTVASGEEAIAYLKTGSADLLVLDMIMDPGMDGLETYQKILELHPHQKAVIASGYSETERVRQAQALGAGAYVKKPYTIEKLGQAVKKELRRG